MLDIQFIRDHIDLIKQNNARRGADIDVDEILRIDDARRSLIQQEDALRAERNEASKIKPSQEEIAKMKKVGEGIKKLEIERKQAEEVLLEKLAWFPNLLADDVPHGTSDADNIVMHQWGNKKEFGFEVKDHMALGESLDIIDTERAVKVAGARFYYLKNQAVFLRMALTQFALHFLGAKGYIPMMTPHLAKKKTLFGTGYLPFFQDEMYSLNGEDLSLIGTSEQTLIGYHQDEILDARSLPILYAGASSCFRTEAGSYGKDTRGILRAHEFYKVEQIVFCDPAESEQYHLFCLENEEQMLKQLELPYQVVYICDADCGAPGYKKYDCEVWFPSQGRYREVSSNTNLTDFQTRRAHIRAKLPNGTLFYPHTISATGITDRVLIAILENYQLQDGSVQIPQALIPYMNGVHKIEPPGSNR